MKINQELKYNDTHVNKIRGRTTEEQYLKHITEISKRSITPDTHKSRTLVVDEKEFVNFKLLDKQEIITKEVSLDIEENLMTQKEELDHQFYVDEYQYKGSKTSNVLHFGINIFYNNLEERLFIHDKIVKAEFLKTNKKIVAGSELGSVINQEKVLKANEYKEDSKKLLTDFEKDIFKQASNYLNSSPETHTVLIDIFARHDKEGVYNENHARQGEKYAKGDIKITLEGYRETHTVVLYKQGDKYLVIDPSNPTFSTILVGVDDQIRVCFNSKLQIYKPLSETGAERGDWRDCVDIAVKLAFNININPPQIKLQNTNQAEIYFETIDYESLRNISSVKEITNQQTVYKQLPTALEKNVWRIKQSSDIIEQKKMTVVFKVLNNAYAQIEDKLSKLDLYESQNSIDKNKSNFYKQTYSPKEYKDAIVQSYNFIKDLYKETGMGEVQLLGMEFNNIENNYEDVS